MSPKHHTTRNDLFVVRFWYQDQDISGEAEGQRRWGGRVQRPVSGESREFNDWNALVEALRAMLAETSPPFTAGGVPETRIDPASESGE